MTAFRILFGIGFVLLGVAMAIFAWWVEERE